MSDHECGCTRIEAQIALIAERLELLEVLVADLRRTILKLTVSPTVPTHRGPEHSKR